MVCISGVKPAVFWASRVTGTVVYDVILASDVRTLNVGNFVSDGNHSMYSATMNRRQKLLMLVLLWQQGEQRIMVRC